MMTSLEAMTPLAWVFASISFVSAMIAFGSWRASKKALKARETADLAATAISLIKPLQDRITELESRQARQDKRVADLEHENGELMRWGRLNYARVVEMGGEPFPLVSP